MNRRMVFYTVGQIVLLEALFLLLPLGVGFLYDSPSKLSFAVTILACSVCGSACTYFARPKTKVIYAKEGFAITSLAWLALSLLGALPFFLSRQIPSFTDAFFETVSGFTTTGASILTRVEGLDRALLFWRSFTHWVGGMGVLVFLAAFLPNLSERSIHILRAEMPGPTVGKLVPRTRDTAKILYLIYLAMSVLLTVVLFFSGMDLYDSLLYTFGTAGTGGFGISSDSAASMTSAQQWILAVGMLLFGVNFNLYYLMLIRRFRAAIRSTELWWYLGIVAIATGVILIDTTSLFGSVSDGLRHSFFQVSSVMTTSGFSTLDFNSLSQLSKTALLMLMLLGACAGSTCGGLKVSRFVLLLKNCMAEFRHMLHPRSVNVLRFEGKKVEKETQKGVTVYFALYCFCIALVFLLLSLNGLDMETNFSAAVSCFNNIGPALGKAFASYDVYSPFSKWVLSFAMLLGRLEIWPILLTLHPATWRNRQS